MKKSIEKLGYKHVLYEGLTFESDEVLKRSENYYKFNDLRRSIRDYSDHNIPRNIIENILLTAGTAPSGAHKQPWTFCAVSNPELKSQIRLAAEDEEEKSYSERMSERWKEDLKPMGTNAQKPFIDLAPWIIVVFKRIYEHEEGVKQNNYYVNESVGIACGMLISAIHHAGLVTLTHTPSPMNFLAKLLNRPENERAFLLLPVGYPASPAYVPQLERKTLNEIAVFYE